MVAGFVCRRTKAVCEHGNERCLHDGAIGEVETRIRAYARNLRIAQRAFSRGEQTLDLDFVDVVSF